MDDPFKLNVFIVDDEPDACELLTHLLSSHESIHRINHSLNSEDVISKIVSFGPDIVFLDVEMPGNNGISLAREIRKLNLDVKIIFCTGYEKYAIQALRLEASDFLLKPIDGMELREAVNKVFADKAKKIAKDKQAKPLIGQETNKRIRFSNRNGFIMVDPVDLIYVQADMNYSELFLKSGEKEVVSLNIGSLEKLLPEKNFFRISRSVVINLSLLFRVDRKASQCTILANGKPLVFPVSRNRLKQLEEKLM